MNSEKIECDNGAVLAGYTEEVVGEGCTGGPCVRRLFLLVRPGQDFRAVPFPAFDTDNQEMVVVTIFTVDTENDGANGRCGWCGLPLDSEGCCTSDDCGE